VGPGGALPPDLSPGFLVPDSLRSRWSLIIGDARHELAPLLERLGEVGLFFHDSHHSYSHMMWEFATVWPYLGRPGLLVSDDISWNTAYWDFASGVGGKLVIHRGSPNVGALSRDECRARMTVGKLR
jgi:methyltransferase family protein